MDESLWCLQACFAYTGDSEFSSPSYSYCGRGGGSLVYQGSGHVVCVTDFGLRYFLCLIAGALYLFASVTFLFRFRFIMFIPISYLAARCLPSISVLSVITAPGFPLVR